MRLNGVLCVVCAVLTMALATNAVGRSSPLFPDRVFAVGSDPFSVAIGDLNGDGIPDLAVANAGSNSVSVLLGAGDGSFGGRRDFAVGGQPFSVAIGDLNGDGFPDLAVANQRSASVSVLLNQRVAPPPHCPGDADASGAVNIKDITSVLSNWGAACAAPCAGDSNADGAVNFADITSVLSNWNRTCP